MYGFIATSKPKAVEGNIKLVRELKEKFSFVYAVCMFLYLFAYLLTS